MKLIFALLLACGLSVTQPACPNPGPNPVIGILIDCIKLEGSEVWNKVQPQLAADIAAGNWHKLVADAEALGVDFGYDTSRCVAIELIQQYLLAKQATNVPTHDARDASDEIRAKAGGSAVTFHTKFGDL